MTFRSRSLAWYHAALSLAATICLILAPAADAQIIRGRVLAPDAHTAAPGVAVIAISASGDTVARTRSGANGTYDMRLRSAGQYRLRVLRIGHMPQLSDAIDVQLRVVTHDIILIDAPIQLDTVRAADIDDCGGRRGTQLVQLWEQARAALRSAGRTDRSGLLIRALVVPGSAELDGSKRLLDSLAFREVVVDRIFASQSPDSLARVGYIRPDTTGRIVYDVPTAEVLVSDSFIQTHCFELDKGSEDLVGIRFKPRVEVEDVSDVKGTLWLDRNTAGPRRVEFDYTNPRYFAETLCGTVQAAERCLQNFARGRGSGGLAEFSQLPTGEWLTIAWTIRTPAESLQYSAVGDREQKINGRWEPCTFTTGDRARARGDRVQSSCARAFGPSARLGLTIGRVVEIERSGETVYADSTTTQRLTNLARLKAGKHPAGIKGTVVSESGEPLAGAVVQIIDPARAVITREDGSFEIPYLPPKAIELRVRCSGYRTAVFPLPLLPDSTRRVRMGLGESIGLRAHPRTGCGVDRT